MKDTKNTAHLQFHNVLFQINYLISWNVAKNKQKIEK